MNAQFEAFAELYRRGEAQVIFERVVADLETPVGTYLKLCEGRRFSFLLESVEGGATRGRYSIIGMAPDLLWRVREGVAEVNRNAAIDPEAFEAQAGHPLDALRDLIASSRIAMPDILPANSAGVFGYLGYDMVRYMERLPDANPDHLGLPESLMMRPSLMAVFDTVKDELYFTAPVYPRPDMDAKQAWEGARERIEAAIRQLESPIARARFEDVSASVEVTSNTPRDDYFAMVARAQDYIAAGDIFQVVLSQRFSAPFTLPPTAFYRALRRTNPSPYMYFLDFGDFAVAGSSPEILVRVEDGEVTVRPIAGTRKRGATPERDRELAEELLADPKERSEHLMLLDLGRNDVGRVSRIGSVQVRDQFFLEYYSHVMHIVSHVTGVLDPRHDVIDALAAGFPAGTVSGAPKVRAMEIIDELEVSRRGIYAGCVGYFGADGRMDTCIVLRTAIIKDGMLHVQAGAGIVADSRPELEQLECENKARALFSAAEEALRYAGEAGFGQ